MLYAALADRWPFFNQLGGRPAIDPLRVLCAKAPAAAWGHKEQGMLRAIAAGGKWTQDRLAS